MKTDKLSAESRLALTRLEAERQGAREAAAVEGLEWVDDWFDDGGESVGPELEAKGDEAEKGIDEVQNSAYEQEGRGRVFLSPVPGAGAKEGKVLCGEQETREHGSISLPFRGFVSSAEI